MTREYTQTEYGVLVFEKTDDGGDILRIYKRPDKEHVLELVNSRTGAVQHHHVPARDRVLIAAFLLKEHPGDGQ